MKKRLTTLLIFCISILTLWSCGRKESVPSGTEPSIVMYNGSYFKSNMPVDELPQDYSSAGTLTAEEANNTGLEGCEFFLNINYDSVPYMYIYQECGTPISENEVDNTKRQWAYVLWVREQ